MAHWLTQQVHQYYNSKFQRNGFDGAGRYPHILVNLGGDPNAAWDGDSTIGFGRAPSGISYTIADVTAHEYTHAVTQKTANLEYVYESGALNESISDIFGTAFERYLFPDGNVINPTNWNWTIAEDAATLRSMANPGNFQQANIYGSVTNGWIPRNDPCTGGRYGNDFCGVHTNSGVMNKWFHTVCTGQGPQYNLPFDSPIDFEDAIQIVYRALRYYLQRTSGYYDALNATRLGARDLYGGCSPQQRTVVAAWGVVGVGSATRCDADCDYFDPAVSISGPTNVACNQAFNLTANCNGANTIACNNVSYSFTGPNIGYNMGGSSISTTSPSNSGNYQYGVSMNKPGCYVRTETLTINVNCASPPLCDFSNGPRYVGTWNGLTVQIRSISGKNVLVTAIPNSATDKYYPRGDNFWGNFTLDPGAAGLQSCLNAGTTAWYGLTMPGGLTPPSGYYQGAESDGAVFYAQNGTNPVNPCDVSPRHVGTWNGMNVEIRTFANGQHALVTAVVGSSNDKYYVRGNNFWDNFTKDAGVDQYRPCLNVGDTDWWGMAKPGSVSPPPGYQQGTSSDGAVFFSTNGLRVGIPEPIVEPVALSVVRPNPAQDEVTVTFSLKEAGDVPVRLLDLQGRVQQAHTYKGIAGKNERILKIAALATGVYAVEVVFDGQRVVHKLVKE